jgi:two-component system, OmpR family, sensor histidine kinase QseC
MTNIFLRPSIARRTFFMLLLASVLAWIAIYLLGLYLVNKSDSGNFDREMLSLADTVRTIAEHNPDPSVMSIALSGLEASFNSDARVLRVPIEFRNFHVRAANGALVARSASAQEVHLGSRDQVGFFDASHANQEYRVYAFWTADRKCRIELTQSMASRNDAFNYVMVSREGMLLPLLVGFPVLLIPIWVAIRLGLRPVRRLSSELALRQPGDLKPLDVPHVDAELVPLVAELNETFSRLNGLLQRERAFLADAAHEMRTPLALIEAQADTLSFATEQQSRSEAIQRLHMGINRCSRLVNQLLDLARLDAHAGGDLDRIDVSDVIRECLASHASEAIARDVNVTYEGPDYFPVMMPRHAFESVVDNLVSNAVRYVQAGGRVVVTLAQQPNGAVQLCVSDDGPGISADDHAAIFDRFRRGAGVTAAGSGLGLAIAASAAIQFGARIDVGKGLDGRGVSFSLEWHPRFPQ